MRAIQPTHRRRGLAAGLVMTSAIALSILGGGTALAKAPAWPTGHGTDFQNPFPDSGASSTTVTAGKSVGFYEWLRNPGSSNISQLFMNVAISPGDQLGVKWTIKTDAGAVVRSGTCVINSMPLCSFGPLNAGQTVYVLAAFRVAIQLVRFAAHVRLGREHAVQLALFANGIGVLLLHDGNFAFRVVVDAVRVRVGRGDDEQERGQDSHHGAFGAKKRPWMNAPAARPASARRSGQLPVPSPAMAIRSR